MGKNTKEYRISGNKVTHMQLESIVISENETLSMLNRYKFDTVSTLKMLEESQKNIEEYKIKQEQKEYEEMNYSAICRRLSEYSSIELLTQLISLFINHT